MEREETRLQCLRMRMDGRSGVDPAKLVEEARILEKYVYETTEDKALTKIDAKPETPSPVRLTAGKPASRTRE